MEYYAYLLRCEGGELYAGITTDVERRFAEHASGGPRAAKYTRVHRPVRVEATWNMPDRASASALEYRLKRLTHAQKEELAANPQEAAGIVAESLACAKPSRVPQTATSHDRGVPAKGSSGLPAVSSDATSS